MVEKTIQMEYCPGSTIEYITLWCNYCPLPGRESTYFSRIDLLSDYTDVNILEGDLIKYSSKYGTLIIERRISEGTANYMTLKFGEIK
jgi:hypothetical protein